MNIESQSLVPNLLQKMFISQNTSQPFAIITEHCLEVLLYILILNGEERISQLVLLDLQTAMELIFFLLLLVVMRLVVGVVLIKIFYPVLLYITLHQATEETAGVAIVIVFLTVVLLVADVLSNIRMDFSSFSITG